MSVRAKLTIRPDDDLHGRLVEHRESTGVPTNTFAVRALAKALDAEGVPRAAERRRRKPAKSA